MKIGILTYHCPPNFGAQLQVVSTVGYLRRLGHKPIVLNWYPQDLENMYQKRIPEPQVLCHKQFANDYLPLSALCRKEKDLAEEINKLELDAIIVGSDALFKYVPEKKRSFFCLRKLKYIVRDAISCEMIEGNPFFGAFVGLLNKRIPASVYAASSQNCPYKLMTNNEKKRMKKALDNYKHISVRDKWTCDMIKTITGMSDVNIFPDPVLAFNHNCYLPIPSIEEVTKKYNLQKNYLLFSFSDWYCDDRYIKSLATEAERNGLQPVALPMPEKLFSAGITAKIELPLSPLDWYALIIHSKGYIGERMHPIIVCLHNAIPFYSFDEYGIKEKKNRFSKKYYYNPLSSKTYLIVSEAGFEDNLYSYKMGTGLPAPQLVMDRIISFDKTKCMLFSMEKINKYCNGMGVVLNSIS